MLTRASTEGSTECACECLEGDEAMDSRHETVMRDEAVAWLTREGKRGGLLVDATLGDGGHAEALLLCREDVRVIGIDQDEESLRSATRRLEPFSDRFRAVHGNFREMKQILQGEPVDGVVMDLGISSRQLDAAERGFSFQRDGMLDMRMDRRNQLIAADILNCCSEEELAKIFFEMGEERASRRIARRVVEVRATRPIRRTGELADLVERVVGRSTGGRIHAATGVFRALRMVVNDELGALEEGLGAAWSLLREGGRLVAISFHSLEDRVVKQGFRKWALEGQGNLLVRKASPPARDEVRRNPRARSALLRVIEKISAAEPHN
jgi:16S rRNA (cytosine1402-N4)-methyltransferase